MSNQIQTIQWANENEQRSYPVGELASKQADDGLLLPPDILVDLGLMIPPGLTGVRLAALTWSPALVSLALVCDQGPLAAGTYSRLSVTPYGSYPLIPLIPNCTGWVTFGSHQGSSQEVYRFSTADQSAIESRAIRTMSPPGVTQFQRQDSDLGIFATGIVTLQVGGGLIAERDPADAQNIILRLDAQHQPIYAQPCSSQANRACQVPVIRSINGVRPDGNGKITLRFN